MLCNQFIYLFLSFSLFADAAQEVFTCVFGSFMSNKCEVSILDDVKKFIQENDVLNVFGACPITDFDYTLPEDYNVIEVKNCEKPPKCNLTAAEQCIENLQKLGEGCRYILYVYYDLPLIT